VARYAVIAAVTDKEKGYKGISSFVMDLENTPGFKVGRVEEKMGILASGTAELIFEDAKLPADALLGKEGEGFKQMLTTLDGGRIGIASQAIGIGRSVVEDAVSYAKTREQFGKPITAFPGHSVEAGGYGHGTGCGRTVDAPGGLAGGPQKAL
jgi:alkylation response protein AidB-like acyl-CoA dehydrogenase